MIQNNYSLKDYNTFGIDAKARLFASFDSTEKLKELLSEDHGRRMILGGGSNILFMSDFDGIVLKNDIKGIEKVDESDDHIYIKAGAGENWHQFVMHCVNNGYAGIENLSLIPGNTGASPMQNIGAYGVEIKDHFHELQAYHINDHAIVNFNLDQCEFGYRESVFKNKYKDHFVILSITYKLDKKPVIRTSYGAIQQELESMGVTNPGIADVSQAVINIRSSKLPDPNKIGNAGSFFKNPSVPLQTYLDLKEKFPTIVGYENSDGTYKLAAGWLIEQCGWKGYRKGDAGCHAKQALVLVNYGNAKGEEILQLSEDIVQSVRSKYGVQLEREVNVV